MKINVQFDTAALKVKTDREIKRLGYNTALALNETAKAVQLEERANLDRKFRIRKPAFMYRLIKIFKFASARQGRPYAEIGIDPTKSRVLLGLFERGGEKAPAVGKNVAVPLTGGPARPSFPQSVAAAFRFTALRLHPRGKGRIRRFHPSALRNPALPAKAGIQYIGAQRSFQIPKVGIFQRIAGGIRAVYLYVRRPRLDARLDFYAIAKRTVAKAWPEEFRKAYRK
jgi:hypothetical protein